MTDDVRKTTKDVPMTPVEFARPQCFSRSTAEVLPFSSFVIRHSSFFARSLRVTCLLSLGLLAGRTYGQDTAGVSVVIEAEHPKLAPEAIPSDADVQQAIDRGVQFLLADQNPDGSWGTAERTKELNILRRFPALTTRFGRP